MNRLLLFEAFESGLLSKTISFLKSKIGPSENFINQLKGILNKYDIPIDKISDDNFQYLSKDKALKIEAPKEWKPNMCNIYYMKFLFSLETGYVGCVAVGNKKANYKSLFSSSGNCENKPFDESELKYIKSNVISTGTLVPVRDYHELKKGDKLVGYLSRGLDDLSKLGMMTIYLSENGEMFAIQNFNKGNAPHGGGWQNFGQYGWTLGKPNDPLNDHHKLHFYINNGGDLRVQSGLSSDDDNNYLNFNLPIDSNGNITEWNKNNIINVNDADFAVILNFDDVLKTNFKKVSLTRAERKSSKEGAIKFMKDEEIKNINIQRYLTKNLQLMGIDDVGVNELKNLQKIALKCLCGDYGLVIIYAGDKPNLGYLYSFGRDLRRLIKSTNIKDKKAYINNLDSLYRNLSNEQMFVQNEFNKSRNIINSCTNESLKEFFSIFFNCGLKLKNFVKSQSIETIEDLTILEQKLRLINNLFENESFIFRDELSNLICKLKSSVLFNSYLENYCGECNFSPDVKKIKSIEKYIDSLR